jgi:DNA-binding LacI/PurR family transcriptional regulator
VPVTMLDIANRLNISQATVSRVLNGKGVQFISAETRRRVIQVAHELGYSGRRDSRQVLGKTGCVALWIRNLDAPYYANIFRTLHSVVNDAGYDLLISSYIDRGAEPPPANHELDRSAWPVDGVLAVDCPRRVRALLSHRRRLNLPLVALGSDFPEDIDRVAFDPVPGVEAAAKHLVSLGRKRVVHLTGECAIRCVRSVRADVFADTIRASGGEAEVVISRDETRAAARIAVKDAYNRRPFDGLFCINDDVAIGAYRGLRDLGLTVPNDVALVGCDNIPDTEYMDPPLTTIDQPVRELCQRGWEMLLRRMADPGLPMQSEVLTPRLVVRGSTVAA